jgi:hypothetical protein
VCADLRRQDAAASCANWNGTVMRKSICPIILAAILAAPATALAHGFVGGYTFLEPIVTEDANPKNEFDVLAPSWYRTAEGREFSLGSSLEKKLSTNTSILLGTEWIASSPKEGPYQNGFNNLEVLLKYAFLTIPEHQLRFSIAGLMNLPTGNPSVQDQSHTSLGPEFLWCKGMGDLPGYLKYLRPVGLQGDFGYLPAIGGHTSHEMFADEVVEYSIPYLSDSVKDFGFKWPLRNMYLYTEFNYDQLITGPSGQTFPDIRVTPGLAYMDHYMELSVAAQLPINSATVPNTHAAVLGLVDLFIDDIFPWTNWTPVQ